MLLERYRRTHTPHAHVFHDWVRREDKKNFDWAASGWAGLTGGAVLLVWELALAPLFLGLGPSDVVLRVAAIAMGEDVLPQMNAFTGLVALTAMVVHLPLSLLYARLLAGIVHRARMRTRPAVAFGALFGAALYLVNFYVFTETLFPWFEEARGWPTFIGHLLYGAVTAAVYEGLLHAHD